MVLAFLDVNHTFTIFLPLVFLIPFLRCRSNLYLKLKLSGLSGSGERASHAWYAVCKHVFGFMGGLLSQSCSVRQLQSDLILGPTQAWNVSLHIHIWDGEATIAAVAYSSVAGALLFWVMYLRVGRTKKRSKWRVGGEGAHCYRDRARPVHLGDGAFKNGEHFQQSHSSNAFVILL